MHALPVRESRPDWVGPSNRCRRRLPVSMAKTRKYRSRVCDTCGRLDVVRADNPAARCARCTRRENGRVSGDKRRGLARPRAGIPPAPRIQALCAQCGRLFPTTNYAIRTTKVHCCSRRCRWLYCGIQRTCKFCGRQFRALKTQVKGITRSNCSAHFCSRECYHRWLSKPGRVSGRGSQWRRARQMALARAPFCGRCGTTKRLDVHHVVPFRMTHDNRQVNLIPLCKKCHKNVESVLNDVILTGLPLNILLLAMRSILRDAQIATFMKIREVIRNGKGLQAEH